MTGSQSAPPTTLTLCLAAVLCFPCFACLQPACVTCVCTGEIKIGDLGLATLIPLRWEESEQDPPPEMVTMHKVFDNSMLWRCECGGCLWGTQQGHGSSRERECEARALLKVQLQGCCLQPA